MVFPMNNGKLCVFVDYDKLDVIRTTNPFLQPLKKINVDILVEVGDM